MKAITVAAAGAALLGSVQASGHHKFMHAHLHPRQDYGYGDMSADPTLESTPAPVEPTPTSWSAAPVTSTISEPVTESTPISWPADPVTTTSTSTDSTVVWEDWSSTDSTSTTSTVPADNTWTTWAADVTTTSTSSASSSASWSASGSWEATSSASSSASSAMTWAPPPSSESSGAPSTMTWAPPPSSVSSPVPSTWSAPGSWPAGSSASSVSSAASSAASSVWSTWTSAEGTSTTTLTGWVTTTIYVEPVTTTTAVSTLTSTVTAGWSSGGWFGPSWSVESGTCAISVITSYGAPTWYPTPEPIPEVTVTVSASEAWPSSWAASSSSESSASSSSSSDEWVASSTSSAWESSSTSESSSASETWPATWTSEAPSANTWTSPAAPEWTPSSSAPWEAPASSAPASSVPAPSPSGGGNWGHSDFSPNGNSWAMTYSPYTNAGGCKDKSTVDRDLSIIAGKGFTTVRVYSTDCSTLENVGGAARAHGLKLILGVWISSTGVWGAQKQVTDIVAWGQWDLVSLIVVGNEAVFNGYVSAPALAGFVAASSVTFKAGGYTGKVTTTEPLTIWESQGSAFCGVVDVVAANLYAFFNAATTADKAGTFIQSQITVLNGICPGKDSYIMESGWPSHGSCNGVACPSPENQATALKGIRETVGAKVVFFSYEDEQWKDPGQFGVEQHWGCSDVF